MSTTDATEGAAPIRASESTELRYLCLACSAEVKESDVAIEHYFCSRRCRTLFKTQHEGKWAPLLSDYKRLVLGLGIADDLHRKKEADPQIGILVPYTEPSPLRDAWNRVLDLDASLSRQRQDGTVSSMSPRIVRLLDLRQPIASLIERMHVGQI